MKTSGISGNEKKRKNESMLNSISDGTIIICLIEALTLMFFYVVHSYKSTSDSSIFFVLSNSDISESNFFLVIAFSLAGVGAALSQFGFLSKKKQLYSLLCLGVKRKALFRKKAVLGISLLFLSSLIPPIISFIINAAINGFSTPLCELTLAHILHIAMLEIFSYSLTVLGCFLCKSKSKALFFAASFPAIAAISVAILPLLQNQLMRGGIEGAYNYFDPSSFISGIFPIVSSFLNESDILTVRNSVEFSSDLSISVFYYIIIDTVWILICTLVLALTVKAASKRFSPERAGISDNSSAPSILISIALIFGIALVFTFTLFNTTALFYDESYFFPVLFGIAIIISIIFGIVIFIRKRELKKALIISSFAPLLFALILLVRVTGGFGYTTYTPKPEDVSKIYIQAQLPEAVSFSSTAEIRFESEDDIKKLIEVNKQIAKPPKDAVPIYFQIGYELKNGKTVARAFNVADRSALDSLYSIYDTDGFRHSCESALFNRKKVDPDDLPEFDTAAGDALFYYYETPYPATDESNKASQILIISKDLTATDIRSRLTNAQFTELKKAILQDYSNVSYKNLFYREDAPLCSIMFATGADNIYKNIDDTEEGYDESSEVSPAPDNYVTFYIYSDMKNTVEFLKMHSLLSLCRDTKTVDAVLYLDNDDSFNEYYRGYNIINAEDYSVFTSSSVTVTGLPVSISTATFFYQYSVDSDVTGKTIDVDAEKLYKEAHMFGTTEKGGSEAIIRFTDGSRAHYYIPPESSETK